MKPRRAWLITATFWMVAVFYYIPQPATGHVDATGLTILIALGFAMGFLFYVLIAGAGDR